MAEIRERIAAISEQAKPLRRDVKLCGDILKRSLILAEKQEQLKQLQQEETKRKQKEHTHGRTATK